MKKARAWKMILAIAAAGLAWGTQAGANVADENAILKDRVDTLEQQVQDLTASMGNQPQQNSGKPSLWSNVDVQFYGYIKADAAYDNSRVTTGNYIVWVDREGNRDDDEFNLTANETRLGFALTGPKTSGMVTTGKVEFDFFGNYAAENKAKIQMRHAYLQVEWPDSDFSLLAGQTWDVISPLNPSTLNYTVLWDVGNIGYRRPQMRITKSMIVAAPTTKLTLQGAISRTIGRDVLGPGAPSESGEDAGFPTLQGRVGLTFPWLEAGSTAVGVSGHWGREEYDTTASGDSTKFDTWSINLDMLQPITPKVTFKAELFVGDNLGAYFGGIGQTVRAVKDSNGVTTGYANEIDRKSVV